MLKVRRLLLAVLEGIELLKEEPQTFASQNQQPGESIFGNDESFLSPKKEHTDGHTNDLILQHVRFFFIWIS
jgi:hypothetical protein